jgi:TRAP-type uncharacterized transport system substrate-binding protein
MPTSVRHTFNTLWAFLATSGPVVLLGLVLLLLAYWALDPTPPKRVTLATGPDQGAYAEFGQRYREQLARNGIEVVLRSTQGSADNLALLKDETAGVDFAFVQGGADRRRQPDEPAPEGLISLGSLFYEPVWLFYRQASARERLKAEQVHGLSQLQGWRVSIGAEGSGVTNLMLRLFDLNNVAPSALAIHRLGQTPAVMALLAGEVDAIVFASAPESPMVQMLLQTPDIGLLDFPQAEAYARRLPIVAPVTLPRGVIDLARDLPSADVRLVAPTAQLVARSDAHPALQQLFVQAADRIHSEAGWFQQAGEFPSPRETELPIAKEAERFFRSGQPLMQRYLPFWMANLVDRMWVVLVSIIAVVIPLSRVLPPLWELRVRSKVFRWYGKLRQIEDALDDGDAPPQRLIDELDALETRVGRQQVPLSHADELYALRSHIGLVRQKLLALQGTPADVDRSPLPSSGTA